MAALTIEPSGHLAAVKALAVPPHGLRTAQTSQDPVEKQVPP
jgi:hypothetical protein